MATFGWEGTWILFVAWNAGAFVGATVLNSFIEWAAHKFVLHKLFRLIPYGYKHTTSHHAVFGANETYHAIRPEMLEHGIGFTWREYILFPIACSAIYAPLELIVGRPIYLGALVAVFAGLIAFDVLHRRFHNPRNTWFQRSRVFRFLRDHHRSHHAEMTKNLNVVLPLADWVLGTLKNEKVVELVRK